MSASGRSPGALGADRDPALSAASDALVALGAILVGTLGALIALGLVFREPALLPLLLGAAAFAAFLLWQPRWIVPAFVGLTWAALPGHIFGGLPSPVEVGGLLLLAFAAWRALQRPRLAGNILLIMGLLAVPLVVSAALSPEGSSLPVSDLRELLFLFIVGLCVYGQGNAERVVTALVVAGLILGIGGISSILIGPSGLFPVVTDVVTAIEPEAPRAGGPFGEPNFFALSMAALAPLALFVASRGGWKRWLGFATLIAIAGAIFAAGSRGGAIAMLFALVAFGATTKSRQLRLAAVATVVVALIIVPFFASQAESSSSRTVSGRETENLIALAMFGDYPIVGVGPHQYTTLYRDYSRNIGEDPRSTREPHSLYLEIVAEQGIVGLIAWALAALLVLSYVLSRGIWRTMLGRAMMLSIATYMVGSLFLHGSQLRLLFMLAGLAMAYATDLAAGTAEERPAETA
ncbi:MAG TPA: O-antigen ligase family protein [Solirubrobacterales bacterium]